MINKKASEYILRRKMKRMRFIMRRILIGGVACSLCMIFMLSTSCGTTNPDNPASNTLTQAESQAMSKAFAQAAMNGFSNVNFSYSSPAGAVPQSIRMPQGLINGHYEGRFTCPPTTGFANVSINMSGTINDTGTGMILIDGWEKLVDFQCSTGGIVFNTDTFITLAGHFSFMNCVPTTAQSFSIGGGFRWTEPGTSRTGNCTINITINFDLMGGHASVSGSSCNQPISISW
jgi:hypothetical protein